MREIVWRHQGDTEEGEDADLSGTPLQFEWVPWKPAEATDDVANASSSFTEGWMMATPSLVEILLRFVSNKQLDLKS